PIMDLSMATGNKPLQDLSTAFVIITEYNLKTQGFLVAGVERIVNMNWGDIHPPPKGTGREHYLTAVRSEEHTSELQSRENLVCRLLLEKKKANDNKLLLRR